MAVLAIAGFLVYKLAQDEKACPNCTKLQAFYFARVIFLIFFTPNTIIF
jgi:hypothetical protein